MLAASPPTARHRQHFQSKISTRCSRTTSSVRVRVGSVLDKYKVAIFKYLNDAGCEGFRMQRTGMSIVRRTCQPIIKIKLSSSPTRPDSHLLYVFWYPKNVNCLCFLISEERNVIRCNTNVSNTCASSLKRHVDFNWIIVLLIHQFVTNIKITQVHLH